MDVFNTEEVLSFVDEDNSAAKSDCISEDLDAGILTNAWLRAPAESLFSKARQLHWS